MKALHRIHGEAVAPNEHRGIPRDGSTFTQQVGHLMRKTFQKHFAIFQENASDRYLTSIQFVTL